MSDATPPAQNSNTSPASAAASGPPAESDEFLKPTVVGVGIATGAVGLLVGLLLMLVVLADGGSRGDGGTSSGTGGPDGEGNFAGSGAGPESTDEMLPSASDADDVREIVAGSSSESSSDSGTAPEQNEEPPPEPPGRGGFSVAAMPRPSAQPKGRGAPSGTGGGGEGFGDVDDRLKKAGAKSGDVQISLAWNNGNDLDLHVMTPSGDQISFGNKRSSDGGELDVDMNAGRASSQRPVENVYWASAPNGSFRVYVHHYANHGGRDPTRYQVVVRVDGRERRFTGRLAHGAPYELVHSFTRE